MKTLLTISTLFSSLFVYTQIAIQNEVLATSGESMSNGSIVVDFTFGETFTNTLPLGSTNVFTQGFQQPARKKAGFFGPVSSLSELEELVIEVYPNPFFGALTIEVTKSSDLHIAILDNSGRRVHSSQLSDIITTLDLSVLLAGKYQLVIADKETLIGRLPIVKID